MWKGGAGGGEGSRVVKIKTMRRIKLNSNLVYWVFAFNFGVWALAETEF